MDQVDCLDQDHRPFPRREIAFNSLNGCAGGPVGHGQCPHPVYVVVEQHGEGVGCQHYGLVLVPVSVGLEDGDEYELDHQGVAHHCCEAGEL